MKSPLSIRWVLAFGLLGVSLQTIAQEPAASPAPTSPTAASNTPVEATPSPEEVMKQLLEKRQTAPAAEPTRRPAVTDVQPSSPSSSSTNNGGDSSTIGTAPSLFAPASVKDANLKREGEFIVNRRGRIVRSPSGGHSLFVFDADTQQAAEPPMLLLPCQLTQSREDMVQERSDRTVFIVSGQVFVYRGTNYLLPTMMKQDFDRGNIQH